MHGGDSTPSPQIGIQWQYCERENMAFTSERLQVTMRLWSYNLTALYKSVIVIISMQ